MSASTLEGAAVTRHVFAGAALSLAIALGARRAGALSHGGSLAAVVVGTVSVAAGYGWGAVLIAFFASAVALSRAGRAEKAARAAGMLEKSDERDATQVLANGGLFAAAALASLVWNWDGWPVLGGGAIAAACADTWGTEVGMLAGAPPRMITTGRPVPAGTSGGVTGPGLLGTVAGAVFIAACGFAAGWPRAAALAVAAGGAAGALGDSLAGALWQGRRHCPRCGAPSERAVHDCGTRTVAAGGVAWLDNDAVNVLCTTIGAAVAFGLWRVFG